MTSKRDISRHIPSLLSAVFAASGGLFLLFALHTGLDDILSARELILSAIVFLTTAIVTCLISEKLPHKTLLLTLITALLAAGAVNFEYPELMKLPVQLKAENKVQITDLDEGASLSMTWAYRFRPRTQQGDPFLTNPDSDISFSQLTREGTWEELTVREDPVLITGEKGASIGILPKFRMHLAVLCLKAEVGTVTVRVPGSNEPVQITPEMTADQPYRVILKNGLLPETAGNVVQILFWSGALFFGSLCGIALGNAAVNYQGAHKKALICLSAFIVPCLIMLILCFFLKITPFGEKSFLINDMWGEYADYMAYFRSILSGENDLFYSFSKSLGDDLFSLLAFYVINPLNWLVILFKPEQLPLAITLLVLLRYGISGFTASVYFVKRRKCGFSAVLFSTCYALMSFNIVNAENTNLRESGLLLPLVILGLEELIENRSARTYILALAGAIFLNFYSGYQICIFSALYFLFYFFSRAERTAFGKTLLHFLLSSLLAAGLTAFLLFPVVLQLRNGPKSFDPEILAFKINMPWSGLFGKLLCSAYDVGEISDGYPSLYTGLICTATGLLFYFNKSITRKKKICAAGFVICCILIMQVNPLNLILHGFNEPLWWPYRYSFIICFFMTLLAQEGFSRRNSGNETGYCLAAVVFGLFLPVLLGRYTWMSDESLFLNGIFLTACIILLLAGRNRNEVNFSILIAALTSLELFLNASHVLMINTAYERSNTVTDYIEYYEKNHPLFDWLEVMDDGFYRIEKSYSRTPNDPMLFEYNGVSHYSSTLNRSVMDFLSRTGFRRYAPYRILYWEGSDIAMDSLLGIKYLITAGGTNKPYTALFTENERTVHENPYALPLAFTASKDILDAQVDSEMSGFELQNQIFSALTGERTEIFRPANVAELMPVGLSIEQQDSDTCYIAEEDGTGSLSWEITADGPDTLYAFFPAENIHPVTTYLNGSAFGQYYDNFSYHILRIGSFSEGEKLTFAMVPAEDRVCMKDAQFYHEDLEILGKTVSSLKQDPTELRKLTSSHLEGSFTASAEKMLFFTIPYSSGWTIRIDGQKVPVYKVFDTFMAVDAPEGSHTLELRYLPAGLIPGIIISLFAAAVVPFIGKKRSLPTES